MQKYARQLFYIFGQLKENEKLCKHGRTHQNHLKIEHMI